ncbi:MAG TPA: bifunctional phosphopantothenoylcysteine decarboxylase/phosphopantothenate--cysteine ligase CoaBC [Armatimonadota bacterium]|nr:bifunctional phosphopantothenoylcysteine decarboxylase/phosphopantothenate--cysteine ligase CoaBC [Armatimonadota bacterium]
MSDTTRFSVVLGITGSIAAYKAADLIRKLRALRDPQHPERHVDVRVVLTPHGREFITPVTLQTVSGNAVHQELFESATAWDVQHVGLADDADVLLIAPATANIMAKLVTGIADDLLSTVALATTAPLLIAPAMNVHMCNHPATQANYRILQERGAVFIGPAVGALACGYEGRGRFAPVEEIVAAVEAYFLHPQQEATSCNLAGRHVLITAGPTREHIDPVRFLSNPSTGKMGYALARAATERGADVTLISGPVNLSAPAGVTVIAVTSAAEMAEAALTAAGNADIIIGAAAPADFTPAHPATQKIKKTGREHETIELVPTVDILATIGEHKRPGQLIVAFAAETERLEEYAAKKMVRKNADFIVANDVTAPGAGFGGDTNRAVLIFADGRREELALQQKDAMAHRILDAARNLLHQ